MQTVYPYYQDTVVDQLRAELYDVLAVADISHRHGRDQAIAFTGHLLQDAESAFRVLRRRFQRYGYTPFFRKDAQQDVVIAVPGVIRSTPSNWMINLVLLILTVLSTLLFGATLEDGLPRGLEWLWRGLPYTLALLGILGVHELGHYFVARWHQVDVTLPYFIPMPFGFGTMGAFIRMKTPIENRKALFDVGVAGPLAGFLLALPLLIVGLLQSPPPRPVGGHGLLLGDSLLVAFLVDVLKPHPPGYDVFLGPVALAAWIGLLVTGFNLLPAGQLDGGHIVYALLGRSARTVSLLTLGGLVVLGILTGWAGWYVWAMLIFVAGFRHPAPLNDITPLNGWRRILGILVMVLFVLLFTPRPFSMF